MMNITEIQIVKSLLDDPKVGSIQLKYNYIGETALFSTNHSSHCEIEDIYHDGDLENITFTPIYHPTPDICVGDLVWYMNKTRTVVHIDENRKEAALNYSKEESNIICQTSDLTLLKKAESNDEQ